MEELISLKNKTTHSKLFCKKLLYSVDLDIESQGTNTEIFVEARGHIRVGPKKSDCVLFVNYKKEDSQFLLSELGYLIPGFNINKKHHVSQQERKPLVDPLALFVVLVQSQQESLKEISGQLFLGDKTKEFLLKISVGEMAFSLNNREAIKGKWQAGTWLLSVIKPPLKFEAKAL